MSHRKDINREQTDNAQMDRWPDRQPKNISLPLPITGHVSLTKAINIYRTFIRNSMQKTERRKNKKKSCANNTKYIYTHKARQDFRSNEWTQLNELNWGQFILWSIHGMRIAVDQTINIRRPLCGRADRDTTKAGIRLPRSAVNTAERSQ